MRGRKTKRTTRMKRKRVITKQSRCIRISYISHDVEIEKRASPAAEFLVMVGPAEC